MDANAAHGSAARSRGHRVIKYVQPGSVVSARGWVRAAEVLVAPLRLVLIENSGRVFHLLGRLWGRIVMDFGGVFKIILDSPQDFGMDRTPITIGTGLDGLKQVVGKSKTKIYHTSIVDLFTM